jgi:Icc-related predicted phosphoesterase
MKVTCCGCLHGYYPELPGGDILIITGDLTASDKPMQYTKFNHWMPFDKYKKIILIGGNHDELLEKNPTYLDTKICYLNNSATEYEGIKFFGSPNSLWFDGINPHCKAFTGSESDLKKVYNEIPDDIDILITHTPAFGILDGIPLIWDGTLFHVGSKSLLDTLDRIKPRYNIFSHIHEHGGKLVLYKHTMDKKPYTTCINCSIMNERYKPVNNPITFEIKNPL